MRKTIGIFAHVDAGKTTLSEQILYHANALKQAGRVDHQSAFMDNHPLEQRRGITIFMEQAVFSIGDSEYTLIDTPGHVDFSAEMERAISVMDAAILVISCVEGVQAHTRAIWRLLKNAHIPVLFFINKLDREGARPDAVFGELKSTLGAPAFLFGDQTIDAMPDELIEELAQSDEALLNAYLSGKAFDWKGALMQSFLKGEICPCFMGSALQGEGIAPLLLALDTLCQTSYDESAAFSAQVYRIRHDENGQRLVFVKANAGQLLLKDSLPLADGELFKVNELRRYNGRDFERVQILRAGQHAAICGLPGVQVGDVLGQAGGQTSYSMTPLLLASVSLPDLPPLEALRILKTLEEEDPQLQVHWLEETKSIQLCVMGKIQLEVLREIIEERFQTRACFGEPRILYKETLLQPVRGAGHYEPLRHYAEVHLLLEPGERGSGIRFYDAASLDALTVNYHNLIKTHVLEKQHVGPLTGSPVTDIKVTLLAGRAHLKHTHGGDFRQATYRAIRQGLFKGSCRLLEPYYAFTILADASLYGRIASDLTRLGAQVLTPIQREDTVEISGRGPVASLLSYPDTLTSLTKGRGAVSFQFDGYEPCQNEQEVIEKIGYNKEADRANPADSMFCAKGAGYLVHWYEADEAMHIELEG